MTSDSYFLMSFKTIRCSILNSYTRSISDLENSVLLSKIFILNVYCPYLLDTLCSHLFYPGNISIFLYSKRKKHKTFLLVLKWEICSVFQISPGNFQLLINVRMTLCSESVKFQSLKWGEWKGTMGYALSGVHLEIWNLVQLLAGACYEVLFPSFLPFLKPLLDAFLGNTCSSGRRLDVMLQQYWGPGDKFQTWCNLLKSFCRDSRSCSVHRH